MSNKSRDEAIDDLKDKEAPKESKQEAAALAEQHTSSSGGSGTVVTKYQLCGKYCGGCPHGPYAWLVDSDGWHYLGKVGGETQGERAENDSYQQDKPADTPDLNLPEWVDNPDRVEAATAALDDVNIERDDEKVVIHGTRDSTDVIVSAGAEGNYVKIGRKEIVTTDRADAGAIMDVIAGFPSNPAVNDVRFDHGTAKVQTDEGTFDVEVLKQSVPTEDVKARVGDFPSRNISEIGDTIDRQRDLSEYDKDTIPDGATNKVSIGRLKSSQYGEKIAVNIDFEDKDDLKNLDWDRAHPNWDGNDWTVDADADAIAYVESELEGKGYHVIKSATANMLLDD